jgi:hypothetical protein
MQMPYGPIYSINNLFLEWEYDRSITNGYFRKKTNMSFRVGYVYMSIDAR